MHAKEHSKKIVSPRRRHLWGAAFGNFTTLGGFIVWLIAFFTLWIVIFLFEVENTPYQWTIKHLQAGKYAVKKIEAFRQENGGKVPDSLIDVCFRKGYQDNQYYVQLPSDMDYFRDIQGYVMLVGHICFISNGTQTPWGLPARRTSRGRMFKVPKEEPSVGGECYWYLDIDRNYGGTLTMKGFEKEE